MPNLSVTEKEHWKTRISARIEKRIEAIKAQHPALFDRMTRQSHTQALESLGLTAPYAELEAVQAEEVALARRKQRAQRAMLAALRSVPLDEVGDSFSMKYGVGPQLPIEAYDAISKRQVAHQEQILAEDSVGREIVRLEGERDRLLDVVWLATSPTQIRTLWSKVAELLGDAPTQLEREALAIEPMKEG